jgi:hypothetical protein
MALILRGQSCRSLSSMIMKFVAAKKKIRQNSYRSLLSYFDLAGFSPSSERILPIIDCRRLDILKQTVGGEGVTVDAKSLSERV